MELQIYTLHTRGLAFKKALQLTVPRIRNLHANHVAALIEQNANKTQQIYQISRVAKVGLSIAFSSGCRGFISMGGGAVVIIAL